MPRLVERERRRLGAEDVEKLMELIDLSINKDRKYFNALRVWRDMVKGQQWDHLKNAPKKSEIRMVVNLAYAHVQTLLPTIFFQDPTVRTMPTHPRHGDKHRTWDAVLNNTNRKIGFTKEIKDVIRDGIIFPQGYAKVLVNRANEGEGTEAGKDGPVEWLSKDSPAFARLSPNQVVVDYLAPGRRLDQARFVAIRYRKTLADLERDPRYKIPKDFILRKGGSQDTPRLGSDQGRDPFDDFEPQETPTATQDEMVTIYEVWVHQLSHLGLYQQMFVLMEGADAPIRQPQSWAEVMGEGFDEYPIAAFELNPIPDDTAVSELQVWENLQVAVNWLMSRLIGLVNLEKQVWEMDTNKVRNPEKAKQQFRNGGIQSIVEVIEPGAFNLVQPTAAGRDNYQILQTTLSLIQQVSGFGANRRGGSGIRTATEADLVEQGVQIKTSEKVSTVAEFLRELVRKEILVILSIVKRFAGLGWVFRVGGETGRVEWLEFTSEDLAWLPDFEIEVDSFRQTESPQEVQKMATAIQFGLQLMQVGLPLRLDELYRRLLVALGVRDAALIMADEMEDAMEQMAELVLILQGQEVEVLPEHNHVAHGRVIAAFKNSELFRTLALQNPGIMDNLEQHEQAHLALLDQQSQQAKGAAQGTNPFDNIAVRDAATPGPTPQSEANQATAPDRTAFGDGRFADVLQ